LYFSLRTSVGSAAHDFLRISTTHFRSTRIVLFLESTREFLPKLEACGQALRKGVGRVRILPAAQADNLPQFYLTRLDGGTEVIVA